LTNKNTLFIDCDAHMQCLPTLGVFPHLSEQRRFNRSVDTLIVDTMYQLWFILYVICKYSIYVYQFLSWWSAILFQDKYKNVSQFIPETFFYIYTCFCSCHYVTSYLCWCLVFSCTSCGTSIRKAASTCSYSATSGPPSPPTTDSCAPTLTTDPRLVPQHCSSLT